MCSHLPFVKDLRPSPSSRPDAVTSTAAARPPTSKSRVLLVAGLLLLGAIALMIASLPVALGRETRLRRGGLLETLQLLTREATVMAATAGILAVALWSGA